MTIASLHSFMLKILAALTIIILVLAAYLLWARPIQLHWGATAEEIARAMPGDELDPTPTFLSTRAITIHGAPAEIWPWLIQMGYTRAGFYGYDILENVGSQRGMLSASAILPEFQDFKVGDKVPISPAAEDVFYAIQPQKYLVWAGQFEHDPGGFTWALYPLDSQNTRLVSRIRWSHHWSQPYLLSLEFITDVSDGLAIRKILNGVKDRVEGRVEPFAFSTAEFAAYLATLLIFMASLVMVLVRPLGWGAWLSGLAAGLFWLLSWYAPIPAWSGLLLDLLALAGLYQWLLRK